MSLYKRKILSFFLIFISIIIASVLWDYIKFEADEKDYKDFLFSNYISNNYNPINETIRFISNVKYYFTSKKIRFFKSLNSK